MRAPGARCLRSSSQGDVCPAFREARLRSGLIQVLWITMRGARTAASAASSFSASQRSIDRNAATAVLAGMRLARAMIASDRGEELTNIWPNRPSAKAT